MAKEILGSMDERADKAKRLIDGGMSLANAIAEAHIGLKGYYKKYGKQRSPKIKVFGEQEPEKRKYSKRKAPQLLTEKIALIGYSVHELMELIPR